jgi:chromosome segregation ATPase
MGLPLITATGNDTLAKRPAKQEQVRRTIEALRQRAMTQLAETSASEIQRLASELTIARAIIEIRTAELREQQRKLRRIERDNARLEAKIKGDAAEYRETYDAIKTELAEQTRENASLIATLSKVRPLRSSR